jgi:FKBP-type peptidyl-prolyl cis-trans isomerase
MKRLFAGLVAIPVLLSTPAIAQDAVSLETLDQKFSYLVGMQLAGGMMQQGLHEKLDVDALAQALRDRFAGVEPRLTQEQMQETIEAMKAADAGAQAGKSNQAKAVGEAFLAENKSKDGVTTTATGVQYVMTVKGDGPMPKPADVVKVHYEGRLLDGTVFDSSYARNDPATFGVSQVIPGWQEALQLMPVGSKFEVWIPSDLAYGAQGAGGAIGPHETLNFTIELLELISK